jgi:hypothetical protein
LKAAGVCLVGGKEQEGFAAAFGDGHLGNPRAHAADVAGKGGLEDILAGAVEALLFGGGGSGEEGIEGQLMDGLIAFAAAVRHEDGDIVAGETDVVIEDEAATVVLDVLRNGGD